MQSAVIILAAGKGSRMRSDLPKVLHPLGNVPLLAHAMASAEATAPARMIVVAGHGADMVEAAALRINPACQIALQIEQKGTAHAADQARSLLAGFEGTVVVLFGDTPFVRGETLERVLDARRGGSDLVVLGFEAEDPHGYGRLITDGDALEAIVETKDANPEQLAIRLCNSGVMAADAATLFSLIDAVEPVNAQGEYYLTDIVGIARNRGLTATVVTCPEAETLGVNSRADLARAEAVFQGKMRQDAMEAGVTLVDPQSTFFSQDTVIGRDVLVEPNVMFGPVVTIENDVTIKGFSHLEGCHISSGAVIGPFARLRPGAEIGTGAKVGNFVEVKNADVQEGAKLNHLSYVGDAVVGKRANIGAGTITCNYDGVFKHQTVIGDDAFVGSNSSLVAPVRIGAGAVLGSGGVITQDVPDGDLAIARARQVNKPGLGAKLMHRLRELKTRGSRP